MRMCAGRQYVQRDNPAALAPWVTARRCVGAYVAASHSRPACLPWAAASELVFNNLLTILQIMQIRFEKEQGGIFQPGISKNCTESQKQHADYPPQVLW